MNLSTFFWKKGQVVNGVSGMILSSIVSEKKDQVVNKVT